MTQILVFFRWKYKYIVNILYLFLDTININLFNFIFIPHSVRFISENVLLNHIQLNVSQYFLAKT